MKLKSSLINFKEFSAAKYCLRLESVPSIRYNIKKFTKTLNTKKTLYTKLVPERVS